MDEHVRKRRPLRTPEAKLRPPTLGRRAVERPRLLAALNDALAADRENSFLMLSAPAGYGKTWLLAQWSADTTRAGVVSAWSTMSNDDRDPAVMWSTIIDSIALACRDFAGRHRTSFAASTAGPEALTLATQLDELSPCMDPSNHSAFTAVFADTLATLARPIVIVVDDAHLLEDSPSEAEFIRILQLLPRNVRVVFGTRSPLHTQSARISGRLIELTADALSFTSAETVDLFADHSIVSGRLDALHDAADGWPAALSLALLSVERTGDDSSPLLDPPMLNDYLQNEVFNDLAPEERSALLTSAVSPLTTAELLDATANATGSAELLRELALKNRMVHRESTDRDGRVWYRVQPLFANFLREKLRETSPERLASMVERASEWQRENGDALTALKLALDPPHPQLVNRVLRHRGYELVSNAGALQLLESIPVNDERIGEPFARLIAAGAAAISGNSARFTELSAPTHLDELGVDDLLEWDWLSYLVQVWRALGQKTPIDDLSSGWPEDTLTDIPDALRSSILLARGLSASQRGATSHAGRALRLALATAENHNDLPKRIFSTLGLASVAVAEFNVHEARRLSDEAIALGSAIPSGELRGPIALAHSLAGWSCLELLDTPAARAHAAAAAEAAAHQPDPDLRVLATHLSNAAEFEFMAGRRRVAQDFVTNWPPPYARGASPTLVMMSLYSGLGMAASLDEPRWSERLLDRARQLLGEQHDWQVAYALYLLSVGREASARTVLTPLLEAPTDEQLPLSEIVAFSLDSVLETIANNQFRAHSALYRALERADATGGYLEVTRVGSRRIAPILAAGLGRFGPHEHVARSLLSGTVGESVLDTGALTDRERDILQELKSLRTVEEIGHDVLLSANTVKTHMRNIYRKLDVTSRRQAVAKAEEIGLI